MAMAFYTEGYGVFVLNYTKSFFAIVVIWEVGGVKRLRSVYWEKPVDAFVIGKGGTENKTVNKGSGEWKLIELLKSI